MADESKIAQLRELAQADPNDELAHFSLGTALLHSDRPQEAVQCFQRVLAVNGGHSKAYQLLAKAQEATGEPSLAIQTLTTGYRVAHKNGDVMPMKAMGKMLLKLGAPEPTMAEDREPTVRSERGDGTFSCRRCSGSGPKMNERPFKGDLGETILATVCLACWKEWVGMGTRVINELRLPLHDPEAQEAFDQHMKEFLMID